jgi:hypothetical protein
MVALAKSNGAEPPTPLASPYGLAMPTEYRVVVVPGAIEVSARLCTPDDVRNLMKVLRAGYTILENMTDGDMDKPLTLTEPIPKISTISTKRA